MALCEKCDPPKEYRNLGVHVKMKHPEGEGSAGPSVAPTVSTGNATSTEPTGVNPADVMKMMEQTMSVMKNLDQRLSKLETPGKVEFKFGVKSEDVELAKVGRIGVDPKTTQIVDETLGEDFGVEVEPNKDKPGFLFTILVPRRLSDVAMSMRPKLGEDGEYIRNPRTGEPELEEYWPGDRRSRAVSSTQSYDAVKDHCERVRSYIVSYYQKMSKPVPEFKLKSNG